MKRQSRTFKISAERNTSARITDDIPLLNWIPHFAMRFLTKMRTVNCAIGRVGTDIICEANNSRNVRLSSCSNKNNFVHYQEWNCARQKLDRTNLE